MWKMFKYATLFNNGGSDNIKNWNLASLETAQGIFIDTSFNQDISAWTFPNEIHLEAFSMAHLSIKIFLVGMYPMLLL